MNIFEGWKLQDLMNEVVALRMENGAFRAELDKVDPALREVEAVKIQSAVNRDERDEKVRALAELSIKYESARRRWEDERFRREEVEEKLRECRDELYRERQCSREKILSGGGVCGTCKTCLKATADQALKDLAQTVQIRDELISIFNEFGRHKPTCRDFWHCTCGYAQAERRAADSLGGRMILRTVERLQVAEMLIDREYRVHFSPDHGGKLSPDCEVCEILVAHMQVMSR